MELIKCPKSSSPLLTDAVSFLFYTQLRWCGRGRSAGRRRTVQSRSAPVHVRGVRVRVQIRIRIILRRIAAGVGTRDERPINRALLPKSVQVECG